MAAGSTLENHGTDRGRPTGRPTSDISAPRCARPRAVPGSPAGGLTAIGEDLLPCLDAIGEPASGREAPAAGILLLGLAGRRRRGLPGDLTAAAALELLQASALVHDDVMDASDTRRGRPAVHRQFASRFAAGQPGSAGPADRGRPGSAEQFGTGAAILIGDMLLAWTDELYHASGFAADVLSRGQPALNAMRTEVAAGQYLDLLSQGSRSTSVRAALRVMTYKTAKYTIERRFSSAWHLQPGRNRPAPSPPSRACARSTASRSASPSSSAMTSSGVFGDPARTGKPVSGDISEGKRTVLMALARDRASASQARVLDAISATAG